MVALVLSTPQARVLQLAVTHTIEADTRMPRRLRIYDPADPNRSRRVQPPGAVDALADLVTLGYMAVTSTRAFTPDYANAGQPATLTGYQITAAGIKAAASMRVR